MPLITSQSKEINASPEAVWSVITDIENAAKFISGIKAIEIVQQASDSTLVGLKWKETREFMGKDAVEVMWITNARAPEFYETRAESHGCVYLSRMELKATEKGTQLTMSFKCEAQTLGARVLWLLTGWMAKKSLCKVIEQDLPDIKSAVEKRAINNDKR